MSERCGQCGKTDRTQDRTCMTCRAYVAERDLAAALARVGELERERDEYHDKWDGCIAQMNLNAETRLAMDIKIHRLETDLRTSLEQERDAARAEASALRVENNRLTESLVQISLAPGGDDAGGTTWQCVQVAKAALEAAAAAPSDEEVMESFRCPKCGYLTDTPNHELGCKPSPATGGGGV